MIDDFAQKTLSSHVEDIIRQQVGSDTVLLQETDLVNDLGIDSLELVELGLKVEKEFGTKLPIAALRSCVTIGDITQLVQQSTAERQVENVRPLKIFE